MRRMINNEKKKGNPFRFLQLEVFSQFYIFGILLRHTIIVNLVHLVVANSTHNAF